MNCHGLVWDFLQRISFMAELPTPTVQIDLDGDLAFDWGERKDALVSASMGPDGTIAWAALIDDWKASGRFKLPAWSEEFSEAMKRLAEAPEEGP